MNQGFRCYKVVEIMTDALWLTVTWVTSNVSMSGDYTLTLHLWFEKDIYEIPVRVLPIRLYSEVWTDVKKMWLSKSFGVKVALFTLYLLPRYLPCKEVWQRLLISTVIHTSGGGGNLKDFSPLRLNNHTFLLLSLAFPSSVSWVHRRHQPFV